MIRIYSLVYLFLLGVACSGLLVGCSNLERPLDSDARDLVDSLSVVGISDALLEIDSHFRLIRPQVLPRLVDSIRRVREKEIEKHLKSIPK